jgi:hypothetical protein
VLKERKDQGLVPQEWTDRRALMEPMDLERAPQEQSDRQVLKDLGQAPWERKDRWGLMELKDLLERSR